MRQVVLLILTLAASSPRCMVTTHTFLKMNTKGEKAQLKPKQNINKTKKKPQTSKNKQTKKHPQQTKP